MSSVAADRRVNPQRTKAVRRFNRFYTQKIGVLQEGLLRSPYSLQEARVLYELAHQDQATPTQLAGELGIDPGYLTRILRALESRGLLRRTASPTDGRQSLIALSPAGDAAFQQLNEASQRDVDAMLEALSEEDQDRLLTSMEMIERLLGSAPEQISPYRLRGPRAGDLGWVVQRHGALYNQEYGWDARFEGLVAEVVATFVRNFDPERERCWIAEWEGENVGSVFLVRHPGVEMVARLRLLLVEPKARGSKLGKRLVRQCTLFAHEAGYRKITLWTNSVLHAARHIYEQEGYRLVHEEPHQSFGEGLIGQTWDLEL